MFPRVKRPLQKTRGEGENGSTTKLSPALEDQNLGLKLGLLTRFFYVFRIYSRFWIFILGTCLLVASKSSTMVQKTSIWQDKESLDAESHKLARLSRGSEENGKVVNFPS